MVNDLKQKGDNTYKKNIFLISHTSFSSGGFVIRLRSLIVQHSTLIVLGIGGFKGFFWTEIIIINIILCLGILS
jgi:hypothetical protein